MHPAPILSRHAVLTIAIAAMALGLAADLAACTKRLRWNDDPPYSMRLPNGQVSGWSVALTEEILRRMGCRMVLEEMPFARALTELKAGRIDMLDGAFPLPERRAYAHFATPVVRSRNMAFIRAADLPRFSAQNLNELQSGGWTIGAQVGVVYSSAYAALQQNPDFRAKLHLAPRRDSLWRMLVSGRVDVVLADELSAAHELAAVGLQEQIIASPLVITADPAAMAFSKATTDLAFVARYDATLEAMKRDGSYEQIRNRYGLMPSSEAPPTL